MFENIGGKIKSLATVIAALGIVGSVISGIVLFGSRAGTPLGILVIVLGSLFSWLGSFTLYGFGELIESNQNIDAKLDKLLLSTRSEEKSRVKLTPPAPAADVVRPGSAAPAAAPGRKEIPIHPIFKESGELACPSCGRIQRGDRFVCLACGQVFANHQPNIPYWCGGCGAVGPYVAEQCPRCGSTKKIMNR